MTDDQVEVALLTQYFYPDIPGTAQITTDLALGLKDSGFKVTAYTGWPAYTERERSRSRDVYNGIRIRRAYSRLLSRDGSRRRLLNWGTVAGITLVNLLRYKKPDVILVDSTSPLLLMVAWFLRVVRKVPYVCLVQDVYPDIAIQLGVIGPNSTIARIWRNIYRWVYETADGIVVLGPRMRDVVRNNIRPDIWHKCVIIPNWADGNAIVPLISENNPLRHKLGLSNKLVVIYSGNMGLSHDMQTIVEAADRLRHLENLWFLFVGGGGGRSVVENMVNDKKLNNVTMLPYQPQKVVPYSLTCGDISLVTLRKGIEGLSVPSKLYSSMAAGLAIVGVVGTGSEIGDVIEEYNCGYRVSQGDVDGLVQALVTLNSDARLLSDMRKKARLCFEKNFTREIGIERYVSLVQGIVGEKDKEN